MVDSEVIHFKVNQANLDTVIAIVDGVEISERYLNSLPKSAENLASEENSKKATQGIRTLTNTLKGAM